MAEKAYLITTTGVVGSIVLYDLGKRTFTHPTVNHNMISEYDLDELLNSEDLQVAIVNGYITVKDENGENIPADVSLPHMHANLEALHTFRVGGSAPPDSTAEGSTWFDSTSGVTFRFDSSRGKWLSGSMLIMLGREHKLNGKYLDTAPDLHHHGFGYKLPRNYTVISISCYATKGKADKPLEVHKNESNIFSFNLSNLEYENASLNLDFDSTDYLRIYVPKETGKDHDIENVICSVEIAWRYDK